MKFPLGKLVMTRGVNDAMAESSVMTKFILSSIGRHARGDWGDLDDEDILANERAIRDAINAVERLGADTRLTDAVFLLSLAQNRVADFIDCVPRRPLNINLGKDKKNG